MAKEVLMHYRDLLHNYFKSLPKTELHLHLSGAYPLSYLKKIAVDAAAKKIYLELVDGLDILAQGKLPYSEGFKYFDLIAKLVNTYEKVEHGVIALGTELAADGVVYAEIRTGLKDLGQGEEEYIRAIFRGIAACPKSLTLRLLISLRRFTDADLAAKTIDLALRYRNAGVVGIDVSGDATQGDINLIIPAIKRAQRAGLYLALHIGESPLEINTPQKALDQALILERLQPDRIGHGVHLSDRALAWVLAHPLVPIEVCPTSSVLAGMVESHIDHPGIKYYLEHNHPIVINTDDPCLFQSSLTNEYCKLMDVQKISMESILQIVRWSYQFAFLPPVERLELYRKHFSKPVTLERSLKHLL